MILCYDGGGSSSRMLLSDDDFNLIGEAHGLGVNQNHTPIDEIRGSLRSCLEKTLNGRMLQKGDEAFITVIGPVEELEALLLPYECLIRRMHEPLAALWAGVMRKYGFVALSGTGSVVFYIDPERKRNKSFGGIGLLLGDEGSGAWIGQQALKAVLNDLNGTEPATLMTKRAKESLGIQYPWDIIRKIYEAPSYVRYMAAFVPEAAIAAHEGDETALSLFRRAGEHLARQLLILYNRAEAHDDNRFCVLSGGVWKAHPLMFETFCEKVHMQVPDIIIKKPYFEPVLAGIVKKLSMREPSWTQEKRVEFLSEKFPGYVINY